MNTNKTNTSEVELRVLIKDDSGLKERLEKQGCFFISSNTIHDIYFCNRSFTRIEQAEMHEVGSYSLRIRKYFDKKGTICSLNTKIITKIGDHHAWEEHETEIENFEETAKILSATEFKPFFELKKTRSEYKYKNLGIFMEDIEDFGKGIEIEILTTPGNEETAKEEIYSFLESIDIPRSAIVPKSITNIVMKERAFKNEIKI
jgi:predicted adenylyl cyclase CyaB